MSKSRMERNARPMSFVNSEVDRPYFTLLTMRTASSQSSTGMTEVTGPKISSWAIRASGLTSAKIVGSKNEPFASAPSRAGWPPMTRSASSRPMAA